MSMLPIQADFERIGRQYPKTDKISQHGYHRSYAHFLAPLRAQPAISMVEIGVDKGGSIDFWRDYFPGVRYWGVDIKAVKPSEELYPGVHVVQGDQSDVNFLTSLIQQTGDPVDFIIDDGSHYPVHQVLTFEAIFGPLLKGGGIYIIEDIETSYWKQHTLFGNRISYGVGHPQSIVEIFKAIADCCNSEFSRGELLTPCNAISHASQRMIESITFAQNALIIVKKNPGAFAAYYNRHYRFFSFT
jgi:hypothetical protein